MKTDKELRFTEGVDNVFKVLGVLGTIVVAAFAVWILFTAFFAEKGRSDTEYDLWGPSRVAEYYTRCLDTRLGYQTGIFGTHVERNAGRTAVDIRNGELTYDDMNPMLKDLGCDPVPKVAYDYLEEYGNRPGGLLYR